MKFRDIQAHHAPPKHPRPTRPPRQADGTTASAFWLLVFSASFLLGLFALAWFDLIPTFLFFAYLGLSLLAFVAYALDKSAARHGRWRTEERTLQGLALLGGWPGALCAQQILRHKTRKRSFQLVFRAATLLNLAALSVLLLTEPGQILLAHVGAQIP